MARRAMAFSAILLVIALLDCKKERVVDEATCAYEAAELRSWLAVVAAEGDVEPELLVDPDDRSHYLTRPFPRVPLVSIDEHASRVGIASLLTLNGRVVTHDKHAARVDDLRSVDSIAGLAAASVLSPELGSGGLGSFSSYHSISILIGTSERWEDVVRVVNGAVAHGVSPISFVFAVPTRVKPPSLDRPSARRMLEIATNAKERTWDRELALVSELRRANANCPAIAEPFADTPTSSQHSEKLKKDFMASAGTAFERCRCRADASSIRAFAWTRYGRHWGAPVTTRELEVSPPGFIDATSGRPVEVISAPKDATWQAAHALVVVASQRRARVSFAVRL